MDVTKRSKRAKLNIIISFIAQIVTILCGVIVPQLLIKQFGSEAYGATASITQFLAYISLLEGGIGGVARAAFYKPLAEGDMTRVSEIVYEIKRFFRVVGSIFVVYVLILACSFSKISNIECFEWGYTFLLVIVISISTFAQYFIGMAYNILVSASQRQYITNTISIITTVLNTIFIILLINIGCDIIIVKLCSSCVFVLKPVFLMLYVKKEFKLVKVKTRNTNYLSQKWEGLGQHIAYFLHSNTDIAVLTVLSNLTTVSVYSVYSLVITHIQNLSSSFSTGMESLFGDMLARKEMVELKKTFGYYETLVSMISTVLFSTTAVMIIPFVRLYVEGVSDADYIRPMFSILMIIASYLYCLRTPYHHMTIAAGHFRQTRVAAYGEAVINILLSIILVHKFGMIGVAIGTLVAVLFRMLYYALYLSRYIIHRSICLFIKREIINMMTFTIIVFAGELLIGDLLMSNYLIWVFYGALSFIFSLLITSLSAYIFYREDFNNIVIERIKKLV